MKQYIYIYIYIYTHVGHNLLDDPLSFKIICTYVVDFSQRSVDFKTSTILVYMILNGKGSSNWFGLRGYSLVSFLFLTGRSIFLV